MSVQSLVPTAAAPQPPLRLLPDVVGNCACIAGRFRLGAASLAKAPRLRLRPPAALGHPVPDFDEDDLRRLHPEPPLNRIPRLCSAIGTRGDGVRRWKCRGGPGAATEHGCTASRQTSGGLAAVRDAPASTSGASPRGRAVPPGAAPPRPRPGARPWARPSDPVKHRWAATAWVLKFRRHLTPSLSQTLPAAGGARRHGSR